METNNTKHTNLLGFEAKEPVTTMVIPEGPESKNEIQVVHIN